MIVVLVSKKQSENYGIIGGDICVSVDMVTADVYICRMYFLNVVLVQGNSNSNSKIRNIDTERSSMSMYWPTLLIFHFNILFDYRFTASSYKVDIWSDWKLLLIWTLGNAEYRLRQTKDGGHTLRLLSLVRLVCENACRLSGFA